MTVSRLSLQGSPNVGIYALATNRYILAPPKISELKARLLEKTLNAPLVRSSFAGTILLGVYAAANSNGMVLPDIIGEEELKAFSAVVGNVAQVESRRNALGNLVLVNDHGALVAESLYREKEVVRAIRDTLGVEVAVGRIAGLPYVGSLASANNKAALVHPERSDEEAEFLANLLKVQVDSGTVNRGSPFVGAGMLCNDSGVVVGSLTAGPELMIISSLFENI